MHCALLVEGLRALTAAWTVEYLPPDPTDKQPDGAEVRDARDTRAEGAATAAAASEKTNGKEGCILKGSEA